MAKKKIAIGEMIKNDMSRRAIQKEPETAARVEVFSGEEPVKKPPAAKAVSAPVDADVETVPGENAGLAAFFARQAQSAGLTDPADLRNYYDFLQSQAVRYTRGFDAGKRFHG